jgi:hypothetical protein
MEIGLMQNDEDAMPATDSMPIDLTRRKLLITQLLGVMSSWNPS